MADAVPCVSIITATYNRSNVLRYTIASVLRSTFTDWEMLVIGDACTDDTAEVVASFGDARIQLINLEQNTGEQSGPNNEGLRRARGRYLAFLNHDDLWMPNHLEVAVRHIEETGADLVYTLAIAFVHRNIPWLRGGSQNGLFEPQIVVPASQWLFRRELPEAIGPWRHSSECYGMPSQEWLFRAWRAKKSLRAVARATVIALPSGARRNSYAEREYSENQHYYERMVQEPKFVEEMLAEIAANYAYQLTDLLILPSVRRIARNIVYRVALAFNQPPGALSHFIRYRRKGEFIAHLREIRGLPRYVKRSSSHG